MAVQRTDIYLKISQVLKEALSEAAIKALFLITKKPPQITKNQHSMCAEPTKPLQKIKRTRTCFH